MIKMRSAIVEDYEVYKDLWTNIQYQWIYNNEDEPEESGDQMYICQEDLDYIDSYYNNFSLDNFKSELKNMKIYMIIKDDSIIGFISLMSCGKGRYKIVDFPLYKKDLDDIKDVFHILRRTHPDWIFIATTFYPDNVLSLGFKQDKIKSFYTL
jgi:hypothetical protein